MIKGILAKKKEALDWIDGRGGDGGAKGEVWEVGGMAWHVKWHSAAFC